MRKPLLAFGFAVALAALPARAEDKEPVATKAYKVDFNRVKEGELPEGWDPVGKTFPAVSKDGGRARLVAPYSRDGAVVYAAVEGKVASFGKNFDLVLDLTTPISNKKSTTGRFELTLPGVDGKDITFDITPNVKGDAYEMRLAGVPAVTAPFGSESAKKLNAFRLTIQRRGDTLSMTSNAGRKEKFLVEDKPVETIPVPEGVKTCAGIKIGIAQQTYGQGYAHYAFELHGLEVKAK